MKARWSRRARLWVEELERRLVPSTVLAYSSNWSGYAVAAGADAVSAVSGSWTVPAANGPTRGYSASWVGIDGLNSGTVEQIGTESDFLGGRAYYYAWYEMYPLPSVTINQPIKANDQITASVSYDTDGFKLTINATDWPSPFTTTIQAAAKRSSAEWVVEAPSTDHVLPLANFGTETITSAKATINHSSGAINAAPGAQVERIDMVTARGKLADKTSALNAAGTGFTVTFNSSASTHSPAAAGGTASRGGSHDNNQSATIVFDPPLATTSPTFVLPPQLRPATGAPQIQPAIATPATLNAGVRTGSFISIHTSADAAPAPADNAPEGGMGAPAAPQAPAAVRPAGNPAQAADLPQARREAVSAPAVIVLQQADATPSPLHDLATSMDLATAGERPLEVAGVVLVLACSGACGIGARDPSRRQPSAPRNTKLIAR